MSEIVRTVQQGILRKQQKFQGMKETNMGKYLELPDWKLGRCQGWPATTLHDLIVANATMSLIFFAGLINVTFPH